MKTLQKKSQNVQRRYIMRKRRVNATVKSKDFESRVLINKSLKYMTAQLILPNGNIVAVISDKEMDGATKTERAHTAGKAFANLIADQNIKSAVFDRNGYLYHGRVKAFAEGLREGGIQL